MIGLLISLMVSAGILGIVIALMEEGDFPGWGSMIICVLAAAIPTIIINAFLPEFLHIIGMAVGACCAGCAISAICGMSVKRSCIAAGIFLGVQFAIRTVLGSMM